MNLDTKSYIDKLDISVSGTTPTGGYLNYENNVLKDGCLTMDEYKVTIEDGEVTEAEKGACENISLTACDSSNFNPSPESWFTYEKDENTQTITITGLSNEWSEISDSNIKKTSITIPCQIEEYDVTSVKNLYGKGLTEVIISDSVVTIGSQAFPGNQITKLIIGNNVATIGDAAFSNNQLTEVIIPDSVTTIGNVAFNSNYLVKLVLGNNITTIGFAAFQGNQLTEVVIPDSLETIGGSSFHTNKIKKLFVSNGVKTIGSAAFQSNYIVELVIPANVRTIESGAFARNELSVVTIYSNNVEIASGVFEKSEDVYEVNGIKYNQGNINLTTIYNNTSKSFDWELIINGTSEGKVYAEGTVVTEAGNVEIVN